MWTDTLWKQIQELGFIGALTIAGSALGALVVIVQNVAALREFWHTVWRGFKAVVMFPTTLATTMDGLSTAITQINTFLRGMNDQVFLNAHLVRMILDGQPDMRFECDMQGVTLWTSPALQDLFGLTSAEMLGNGWLAGIHPDDLHDVASQWKDTVSSWVPYRVTYRAQHVKSRKVTWVEATAVVIRNAAGAPLAIWGKIVQITPPKDDPWPRRPHES